jgi:hypothetical protein
MRVCESSDSSLRSLSSACMMGLRLGFGV